jgi:hypothetical protein
MPCVLSTEAGTPTERGLRTRIRDTRVDGAAVRASAVAGPGNREGPRSRAGWRAPASRLRRAVPPGSAAPASPPYPSISSTPWGPTQTRAWPASVAMHCRPPGSTTACRTAPGWEMEQRTSSPLLPPCPAATPSAGMAPTSMDAGRPGARSAEGGEGAGGRPEGAGQPESQPRPLAHALPVSLPPMRRSVDYRSSLAIP